MKKILRKIILSYSWSLNHKKTKAKMKRSNLNLKKNPRKMNKKKTINTNKISGSMWLESTTPKKRNMQDNKKSRSTLRTLW